MNIVNANVGQDVTLPEGSEVLVVLNNVPAFTQNGPNFLTAYIVVVSSSGIRFSAGDTITIANHLWVTGDKIPISFVNSGGPGAGLHAQGAQGDKFVITV